MTATSSKTTTECRVCNASDVYIVKRLERSSWALCRKCLCLQRTPLEPSFADRFILNAGYEWGVATEDFSEDSFRRRTEFVGSWWDFFANQVRLKEDVRVLDFGSGTSPLAEHLKHHSGVDVIGIEPSLKNEAFSKSRGHKVVSGFLHDGMFDDQTFDVVHLGNCGQFVPDLLHTFRIFHKILKTDGYIFWGEKEYHFSGLYPGNVIRNEGPAFYFSKPALHNLLTLAGFEVAFYRNLFGEFRLIARKLSHPPPPTLRGSFMVELLVLKTLPVTDVVFDQIQRVVLKPPPFVRDFLKPMARKMKLLP